MNLSYINHLLNVEFSGLENLIQKLVSPTATTDLSTAPEVQFNYGAGFSITGKPIKIFEDEKNKSKTLMVLGNSENQNTDLSICFVPLSLLASIEVINPHKFIHLLTDGRVSNLSEDEVPSVFQIKKKFQYFELKCKEKFGLTVNIDWHQFTELVARYNLDQIVIGLLDVLHAVAHDSIGKEALANCQNLNLTFQGDQLSVQVSPGTIELSVGKKMFASNWNHALVEALNRSLG